MNYTYFPGCTLRTKAKELDRYARASAEALGFTLTEPENWQCCGGVFQTAKDEIASKLPSVRALIDARDKGEKLVTVCSACYNVLKQTNNAVRTDPDFTLRVNNYLSQDKIPTEYHGETEVIHYLEVLRDEIGFDELKKKVVKPLTGRKIAAYYGCLLLRPGKVMQLDDPENPTILEDFISALGAEPVVWSMRNECCGGYIALEDAEAARKRSNAVSDNAAVCNADSIVTASPLCKYNLAKNGSKVPVVYFTELLAEALGVKEEA